MIKRNYKNYYVVQEDTYVANIFCDTDWDDNGNYLPIDDEAYSFQEMEDQIVYVTTDFDEACRIADDISYGNEFESNV